MIRETYQWAVRFDLVLDKYQLQLASRDTAAGRRYFAKPIVMEAEKPATGFVSDDLACLGYFREDAMQGLIDALWQAGLRPSSLRRQEASGDHLQDMRAIAFGLLAHQRVTKP